MRKRIYLAVYLLFILMLIPAYSFAAINLNISNSTTTIIDSSTFKLNNITADIDGVAVPGQYWIDFKWDSVNLVFVPINIGAELNYKTADYYPLGQGDTWTYVDDESGYTTWTVSGTETINGVIASKVMDMSEPGAYHLYTADNSGLTMYKFYERNKYNAWEQTIFSPPLIYIPGEISEGKTYTSATMYSTSSSTASISVQITVKGIEDITVIAGTFKDCLKLNTKRNINSSDGRFTQSYEGTVWLAKGIGRVKETGQSTNIIDGQTDVQIDTEELVSATVGGVSYP
jgi:hypothetical protein